MSRYTGDMIRPWVRPAVVVLLAFVLVVGFLPSTAAAQSGIGGTVIVEEGETVSEVNSVAGSVIVRGTVAGDVSAFAGDVYVTESGVIEGDLSAAAGNVRIAGTVNGEVASGAGNVRVEETGVVQGSFQVGAGNVIIDGEIAGDATIGAETIRLGDDARIGGSLTYDGNLEGNQGAVEGDITRDRTLGGEIVTDFGPLASAVFSVYAFLFNLILGAFLLAVFPRFSAGVADRVATDPIRTGLVGLGVLIAVPILLLAFAITVIGIPITIVGAFVFVLVVWIGIVYGRYAVGAWLLSLANVGNKWAGLLVGLLIGAILAEVPIVGGLINFLIFLLGLGALSIGLYAHLRGFGSKPAAGPTGEPAAE